VITLGNPNLRSLQVTTTSSAAHENLDWEPDDTVLRVRETTYQTFGLDVMLFEAVTLMP
jgi:hypothetical protein